MNPSRIYDVITADSAQPAREEPWGTFDATVVFCMEAGPMERSSGNSAD